MEGNFFVKTTETDEYSGDKELILPNGGQTKASIIFDMRGSGDYAVEYIDRVSETAARAHVLISESADDINYTEPIMLMTRPGFTSPDYIKHENLELVKEKISWINDLWRYSGNLQQGNRYLKITVRYINPGSGAWATLLSNIKLNQNISTDSQRACFRLCLKTVIYALPVRVQSS